MRNHTELDRNMMPIIYTKHAQCRMDCRHIDETEVKEILQKGTINYTKSDSTIILIQSMQLEGITHDGQEVRIIFAQATKAW